MKLNIKSESLRITHLMREKAKLVHEWSDCFWINEEGYLVFLENDYKERIDKIEEMINQSHRTIIRYQEELKELEEINGDS